MTISLLWETIKATLNPYFWLDDHLSIIQLKRKDQNGRNWSSKSQYLPAPSAYAEYTVNQYCLYGNAGVFRLFAALHVLQVICNDKEEKPGEEKQPGETNVSVQLFDSPPMNISVPGDIPWTDPKFSEVVAQKALDHYKESSV